MKGGFLGKEESIYSVPVHALHSLTIPAWPVTASAKQHIFQTLSNGNDPRGTLCTIAVTGFEPFRPFLSFNYTF